MPLNCGIVGLPNVGKSTIFNALTSAKAQAANYPFCTIDPNTGVVTVPDERLEKISKLVKPKSLVPTSMEFIDIAGLVEGLSEGIHFAKKSGLDVQAVIDTISKGAAQSWQMENRYKTMNEGKFDFGFAVEWMRKDLSICLAEARRNGASLPVTALVDAFYAEVEKLGGKRWDTSSLLARLER